MKNGPGQWQLKLTNLDPATDAESLIIRRNLRRVARKQDFYKNTARVAGMKKRTTITTEKREIWIIREEGTQTHVWNQPSPSDQASEVKPETDMALTVTEEKPPTTNEEDQRDEV